MQLSRSRTAAALLVSLCALAHAEDRVDFKLNYFIEPARSQRLNVVMPQLSGSFDVHPNISVSVGYDADIVSGATPRVYGSQVDAVSSATKFHDVRQAPHAGAQFRVGPAAIDVGYTFSTENDYRSHQLNTGAKVDLWGKNTTLALGYSRNWDKVCDVDNSGASPLERQSLASSTGCFASVKGLVLRDVSINTYSASLTQIFHPLVVGDVTTSFEVIDGFQSNPYRRVRLFSGTVEAQESVPLLRQRVSVQVRLRVAVPKAKAAVHLLGRFYTDTWGIKSATAEVSWEQYVLPQLLLAVRGRFYQQGRAVFYRDAGEKNSYESVGPVGQYFTGDREMSPLRNYLVGARLSYLKFASAKGKLGKLSSLDLHAKVDFIGYQALTKLPPNLPRSDGVIDAIVAQLGLALLW
ncbi:MAG: DUF3570 domain-containing protein [Polyangia bacterium]